jgi:hypothetical protein
VRFALLILSLFGASFFGGVFILSFVNPVLIEQAAREVVRIEVERSVGQKIEALSNSRVALLAQKALDKAEVDVEQTQRAIRDELPRKIAIVVGDMLNANCECRKRLVEYAQLGGSEHLSSLTKVRTRLVSLIELTYASVTTSLLREVRIFTASNAAAFMLLGLVTLLRRKAKLQLVFPALVLVGAVLITGGIYLFNQNWLHTIVFGEYVGFAYTFYLTGVALLLADVIFNRARVTTRLVNSALQVVGSAATATPC